MEIVWIVVLGVLSSTVLARSAVLVPRRSGAGPGTGTEPFAAARRTRERARHPVIATPTRRSPRALLDGAVGLAQEARVGRQRRLGPRRVEVREVLEQQ